MSLRWGRPGARAGALLASLTAGLGLAASVSAHPMGNFSISHYSGIRLERDGVVVRYLIDMAEVPTFQEVQDAALVAEPGHPTLAPYLTLQAERLRAGLRLEIDGRPHQLETVAREILVSPGAGGLPTLRLGIVYRAVFAGPATGIAQLAYRDDNFRERVGWKEIVATAAPGVVLVKSSVPAADRSGELASYPRDLLDSPPQVIDAQVAFALDSVSERAATGPVGEMSPAEPLTRPVSPREGRERRLDRPASAIAGASAAPASAGIVGPPSDPVPHATALRPDRRGGRGGAAADLVAGPAGGLGMLLLAALAAVVLGGLHALEPGHGKTVVAAYLVGARGTARHALLLGLTVTASHTAGVYLLGGVTLYASRYILAERLYPWLAVLSGLTIAGLGFLLFLRRYAGVVNHRHAHRHDHGHHHDGATGHVHGSGRAGGHAHPHVDDHGASGPVSLRELVALGVGGGIVPCPGALVVLLSAVALGRIGFGLFLIAAFSLGLAAVLVAIGLLMVYARRLMANLKGGGPLVTRWLPLVSSAVMTVLGVVIAVQALVTAGIVRIRLA